jgi:hypothetical protein
MRFCSLFGGVSFGCVILESPHAAVWEPFSSSTVREGVSLETSVHVEKEDVVVPNTVVDDNGKLPE